MVVLPGLAAIERGRETAATPCNQYGVLGPEDSARDLTGGVPQSLQVTLAAHPLSRESSR